jgi:hypothetical protein
MRVFSNRWTGVDVEKRITSYVSDAQHSGGRDDRVEPRPETSLESVVIDVTFSFSPAGTEVTHPAPTIGVLKIAAPHIVVVVGLPLPPAGTIANLYDNNVRRERQWHERLTGAPVRQEKHVALRTWATGLLVASGCKTRDAMRDVCAIIGEDEVTQVQFTEDRLRLVERVPEAKPFLYAKPPRRSSAHDR